MPLEQVQLRPIGYVQTPYRSLAETRGFFAPRAAAWEERFPDDDDPAYAAAVAEVGLRAGRTAPTVSGRRPGRS